MELITVFPQNCITPRSNKKLYILDGINRGYLAREITGAFDPAIE